MSEDPKVLLQTVSLRKKFLHEGREVEVLKGVDLEIQRGEMLSVVGASGAGKSTLLHILGTLDLPTSGQVLYEGQDVTQYSSSALARFRNQSLGFVFQFHHLLPEFTAVENVMMPGLIRGGDKAKLKKQAQELLDDVGLNHRLTHRPSELSGGEQQRVALARALIMSPMMVMADEPTGNLDSDTSSVIHQFFQDLNTKLGTTFLIVTHNRELADSLPRKLQMRDGVIVRDERRDASYRASGAHGPEEGDAEEGDGEVLGDSEVLDPAPTDNDGSSETSDPTDAGDA